MESMFKKIYMRELYTDANPFQYIQALDTVQYYDQFTWLSQEYFDPSTAEFFDGDRILKHTCYNPL